MGHRSSITRSSLRIKRLDGTAHNNGPIPSPYVYVKDPHKKHTLRTARISHRAYLTKWNELRKVLNHPESEKVKTLADMTQAERAAIEERYGAKIAQP